MATVEAHRSAVSSLVESPGLYEVVDGEVREKTVGVFEVEFASRLFFAMASHVQPSGQGRVVSELLFLLDPKTKLQRRPDLAFVSSERWPLDRPAPRTAAWDVVPELVVEVLSPTDLVLEMLTKVNDYFRAGVGVVWMFHPVMALVYVYRSPTSITVLTRGDTLEGDRFLPGFGLPLIDLFGPEPLPEGDRDSVDESGG